MLANHNANNHPARLRSVLLPLEAEGFAALRLWFDSAQIDALTQVAADIVGTTRRTDDDRYRWCTDGHPRVVFGVHQLAKEVDEWASGAALELAERIRGTTLHLYQTKLTRACRERGFDWHQDFAKWSERDGVPSPVQMITIAVFLDRISLADGPLTVISGSQAAGLLRAKSFGIDPEDLEAMQANRHVSVTGDRGTVAVLHPLVVHGSPPSTSGGRRLLLFATFNGAGNAGTNVAVPSYYNEEVARTGSAAPAVDGGRD